MERLEKFMKRKFSLQKERLEKFMKRKFLKYNTAWPVVEKLLCGVCRGINDNVWWSKPFLIKITYLNTNIVFLTMYVSGFFAGG